MTVDLNPRQRALVEQVRAADVTEDKLDTEAQLLTLARLGVLDVEHGPGGYTFTVAGDTENEQDESSGSEQSDVESSSDAG